MSNIAAIALVLHTIDELITAKKLSGLIFGFYK